MFYRPSLCECTFQSTDAETQTEPAPVLWIQISTAAFFSLSIIFFEENNGRISHPSNTHQILKARLIAGWLLLPPEEIFRLIFSLMASQPAAGSKKYNATTFVICEIQRTKCAKWEPFVVLTPVSSCLLRSVHYPNPRFKSPAKLSKDLL